MPVGTTTLDADMSSGRQAQQQPLLVGRDDALRGYYLDDVDAALQLAGLHV